jgi:class 3 adenylate cyclase/TPR repeat protein
VRSLDEIRAEINAVTEKSNAARLRELADELSALNSPEAQALEHDTRGLSLNLTGYFSEALESYQRAVPLVEQVNDPVLNAKLTGHIGLAYHGMGNYPKALEHFTASRDMFEALGDRASMARATSNIGVINFVTGAYSEALEHHNQVLALFTELGDRNGMARAMGNIGVVYASTGAYPEAIDYYYRALAIHEELGNRQLVAITTDNIGLVYSYTGSTAEALDHYQRALAMFEELGNRAGQAQLIDHIGTIHSQSGDYEQALDHFQRALALHEELGDRASVAGITGSIGSALFKLGRIEEARTVLARFNTMDVFDPRYRIARHSLNAHLLEHDGELDAAVERFTSALEEAREHGLRIEMANIHESLRDLARKNNDFAGYIEHNDAFVKITEEVRGKETTQRMAMQEAERRMATERIQRDKERAVLYSALPKHVADRVVRGEKVSGDHYDNAAVLFLDIVGFTTLSDLLPPSELVHLLERIFTTLDTVCRNHSVTKIKTIGDSYMAVAFPSEDPEADPNQHIVNAGLAAMEMFSAITDLDVQIQVRVGMHCGPVTAGVIGTERLQYDVWGDTVNVASRLEGSSEPGRVHVSEAFANALNPQPSPLSPLPSPLNPVPRGTIEIKGKGQMSTYWLERT